MVMLASLAGMRVSEIARVRGEDLDLGRAQIWVVGKGVKRKSIPLHPLLVNAAHTMPRAGWWFKGEYEREGECVSSSAYSVLCLRLRAIRRFRATGCITGGISKAASPPTHLRVCASIIKTHQSNAQRGQSAGRHRG
jgi:integrase